jgi:ribosomal-protein-alanine N-acetyltransferase
LPEIVLLIDATTQAEEEQKNWGRSLWKKSRDLGPRSGPRKRGEYRCVFPASSLGLSRYNGSVRFRIRQFEQADFETLWRIDQSCFDPQLAYSRPELAFYIRRPGAFTLLAEAHDADSKMAGNGAKTLGFIVAESRRKNGHIITIDVIAEARRSGIGSSLLRAAEEKLTRAGTVTVTLETPVNNLTAIRFYKREGYFVEKTVAGYYSGLLDALVMTKELPPLSM